MARSDGVEVLPEGRRAGLNCNIAPRVPATIPLLAARFSTLLLSLAVIYASITCLASLLGGLA